MKLIKLRATNFKWRPLVVVYIVELIPHSAVNVYLYLIAFHNL